MTSSVKVNGGAPAARVDEVVDMLHGVSIADPYRWLEDGSAPDVQSWVEAQNSHTARYLEGVPGRRELRARLEQALSVGLVAAPQLHGGRTFYLKREGDQNQPVLVVRESAAPEPRLLVDPNTLREDGTAALDWWQPSHDGAQLAYGVSEAGDEKSTLHVLDVASGRHVVDQIPHTRYSSVAWLRDGSGFYYSRYPTPGTVPAGDENYNQRIFFHRLGDDWTNDRLIFGAGRNPETMYGLTISTDGRWLVIMAMEGWAKAELYLLDTSHDDRVIPIVEGQAALFSAEVVDGELYILTNQGAPRFQLFKTSVTKPSREHWRLLVPEGEHVLQSFAVVGGKLVLSYLRNAAAALVIATLDGAGEREVPLPTLGSVDAVAGEPERDTLLFSFVSFFVPPTIYRYDISTGALDIFEQVQSQIDTSQYEVRQVWYPSKDGTRISMFVMHRRGILLDGNNPTLLTGYGGFNVSMTPSFWRALPVWLDAGGVAALANLRGGAEYGEQWHAAGMLGNKQNVFDDFIAAAEFLVGEGYTKPAKLAISGGSNGGLLVGAALTQRPELFKAVVCRVPLLDMLRYHHFLIARLWIPEYGSADDSEQFRWLHAYSPYHNVREGTRYPATLFTTAESDSRVDPLHARKMAALLQARNTGDAPILLRVETRAGHGAGKPLSKVIDEETDIWTFVGAQLGVDWQAHAR